MGPLACARAAEVGHLEVLKYLREHDCPRGAMTCMLAVEGGYLERVAVCAGAQLRVGPGDVRSRRPARAPGGAVVGAGAPLPMDERTCRPAAQTGRLESDEVGVGARLSVEQDERGVKAPLGLGAWRC